MSISTSPLFPVNISLSYLSSPYSLSRSEMSTLVACNPDVKVFLTTVPQKVFKQLTAPFKINDTVCRFYNEFASVFKKITTAPANDDAKLEAAINELTSKQLQWFDYSVYCHQSKEQANTCEINGSPFPQFLRHDLYKNYLELLNTDKIDRFEGRVDLNNQDFLDYWTMIRPMIQLKTNLKIVDKLQTMPNPADYPSETIFKMTLKSLVELKSQIIETRNQLTKMAQKFSKKKAPDEL